MVPGFIGNIQAIETVKIILGRSDEEILVRRMLFFDALAMTFRNVKLRERNKACAVCGDEPTIRDVKDFNYEEFC